MIMRWEKFQTKMIEIMFKQLLEDMDIFQKKKTKTKKKEIRKSRKYMKIEIRTELLTKDKLKKYWN